MSIKPSKSVVDKVVNGLFDLAIKHRIPREKEKAIGNMAILMVMSAAQLYQLAGISPEDGLEAFRKTRASFLADDATGPDAYTKDEAAYIVDATELVWSSGMDWANKTHELVA